MSNSLIEVKDLKVYFKQKSPKLLSFKPGILKAVDQVSFSIEKGKTFGLVGESGSGKSTIGKAILRYHKPTGGGFFTEERKLEPWEKKSFFHTAKKCSLFFRTRIHPWTQVIPCRILSVSPWKSINCIRQKSGRTCKRTDPGCWP